MCSVFRFPVLLCKAIAVAVIATMKTLYSLMTNRFLDTKYALYTQSTGGGSSTPLSKIAEVMEH